VNVNFAKRAAIAAVAAASVVVVAAPAFADPTEVRELAGVGSDTTQDVMNGLSQVIADPNHTPANLLIASYNATGSAQITTRGGTQATTCTINRPDGSGAGVKALRDDIAANTHCLDFARSSSKPNSTTGQFTFIPFGLDAVTLAKKTGSTLPANVTTQQLQRAYNCQNETTGATLPAGTFPTINGVTVHPLVPQPGSGTRKFWASTLGFNADTLPSCVSDHAKDGSSVQEHNGSALQRTVAADGSEDVMPFSIAQYIAQGNGLPGVTDRRNGAVLESVDGAAPVSGGVLNTAFPIHREVYNVVQTSRLTETDIKLAFVGATSKVCSNSTTITNYGFGTVADCGDTSLTGDLV
jgi:ABC-type phosphate transport system substrate-binding protein